jgi:hypothetical protein
MSKRFVCLGRAQRSALEDSFGANHDLGCSGHLPVPSLAQRPPQLPSLRLGQ